MSKNKDMMSFAEHLEVLRKMLLRILATLIIVVSFIFLFKDVTFSILLSPGECDFLTYRWIEKTIGIFDHSFRFTEFHVSLIATDLSSQFMIHISTAIYLGLLCISPYILYEVFKFVTPALLENERKYSVRFVCISYTLFIFGVLMSYFILFPISFRFLGTYSVSDKVHSTITLDSYITTFVTLTFLMGLVFQLPVLAYILGRIGLLHSSNMIKYRSHAFLLICLTAAIITPPDIMSLILVAIPLYILYEVSIRIVRNVERHKHEVDVT